jgi:transcription antitermination factor NusG
VWLLGRCHPVGHEFRTRARLAEADIFAWVPVLRKPLKSRHVRKPRLVEFPLLGPYLLICAEDVGKTRMMLRERVRSVHLVSAGYDRGPLIVPDEEMIALWRREQDGEFDRLDLTQPVTFKIGDAVLIVQGALVDRCGVVARRFNGHRYAVDVGRLTVTVRGDQLQLANLGGRSSK